MKYTFCRKDQTIKQYYIPVCKYIVKAKITTHEITVGRSDTVIKKYSCYTTPNIILSSRKQSNYITKIREICSNFNVITKEWLYPDLSVELYGENVKNMIDILNDFLGRR